MCSNLHYSVITFVISLPFVINPLFNVFDVPYIYTVNAAQIHFPNSAASFGHHTILTWGDRGMNGGFSPRTKWSAYKCAFLSNAGANFKRYCVTPTCTGLRLGGRVERLE